MKFKDFLETNAGLERDFFQKNSHLPKYVQRQVLHNRVAPRFKQPKDNAKPTIDDPKALTLDPSMHKQYKHVSLKDIYNDPAVKSITDKTNWELKTIKIHPDLFTDETKILFQSHEFGSSPLLSKVRDHETRMQSQLQIAKERGNGKNEPIVLTVIDGKYKVEEGWHRIYSHLIRYSAPKQHRKKIIDGKIRFLNFDDWKPTTIKAYIGN